MRQLKASISLDPSDSTELPVQLTNLKRRKPLSEKFKHLVSSLLGKDKLLSGIVVFHHHCFSALDVSDWAYLWGILVIVATVLMIQSRSYSLMQTKYLIKSFYIHKEYQINAARAVWWLVSSVQGDNCQLSALI